MLPSAPAYAHASLIGSDPADGRTLAAAPPEVLLRFDEPVLPISLRLIGPGGTEYSPTSGPTAHDRTLRAVFPADLPAGLYLLSYRVASADSHPVSGTIAFAIGAVSPASARAGGANAGMVGGWIAPSEIARWLYYVTLVAAVGGALFRALVSDLDRELRRLLALAAVAAAGLAVLQVGLRGALLADLGWPALLTPAVWSIGARTTLFVSLLVSSAGLLTCAAALPGHGWRSRIVGAIGASVAIAGFPLSGHAAAADPRWLTAPALAVHTLAVALWLGAFLPLRALLGSRNNTAEPAIVVVRRFASLAVPAVALLLGSGAVLAAVQVARPAALLRSPYGLLLLGKLAAVLLLLGLAVRNHLWLTPALAAARPNAAGTLRASVGGEIAISGAVLAFTAVLTLTPPARILPSANHQDLHVTAASTGGLHADIDVAPGRPGWNTVAITLRQAAGTAALPKEVWLAMRPNAEVEAVRRRLLPDDPGRFVYSGPELAFSGNWNLRVEVLLTDFDQAVLTADVAVQ